MLPISQHDHSTPCPQKKANQPQDFIRLNGGLVGNWYNRLGYVLLHGNGPGLAGHGGLSLQVDVNALSLGLLLELGVGLDALDELLAGSGQRNVLDSEVDTLLNVPGILSEGRFGGLGWIRTYASPSCR